MYVEGTARPCVAARRSLTTRSRVAQRDVRTALETSRPRAPPSVTRQYQSPSRSRIGVAR